MELATSIGISITEFWEITPYELSVAVKGFGQQKQREAEEYKAKFKNDRNLAFYQAFLISRWVWQKKVNIDELLKDKPEKKKVMTNEEMLAQVKMLNLMFGGEVIDGTEK
jgi:hypothetical protein